jgi:hypothetical protein
MLKFNRSLSPFSGVTVYCPQSVAQFLQSITQKRLARLSLVAVLGLTGINCLLSEAIAPQSAYAYTARLNVSLARQPSESYRSFVRRAEAVARAAAQRSFDRDILVSDVAVTIVGQNNGSIAPVLSLNVTRPNWRRRPDAQRWATYFPDTQKLLGFSPNNRDEETGADGSLPPPPGGAPNGTTPGRVITLPGGVRLIPNPSGRPQQQPGQQGQGTPRNGATQQNQQQQQGTPANGTNQQNTNPNNRAAPSNAQPPGAAPGQVIEIPGGGGVRLIPNPGGTNPTNQ